MKTAASFAEVAARRGWVNPLDMPYAEYLRCVAVWQRLYRATDLNHHFRAATREIRPNKVSMHRMDIFTDAYNLAKLRGEL